MSKGLEALERLKMFPIYQETKRIPQQFRDKESINFDLSIIEKELKALEIIKKKKINVYDEIYETIDYENYISNFGCTQLEFNLTKEEYDLLKEVLL